MNSLSNYIASALSLPVKGVENTLELLGEGCTLPFISRYRKERTGSLDEVQIADISNLSDKLNELGKRKETILKTIEDQGKLTDELKKRIEDCWEGNVLEDIYLPYKPKRRTRAQIAREQGLQPLADILMLQRDANPEQTAKRFIKGDIKDAAMAIQGAKDIIAETVSENEQTRNTVRALFRKGAVIASKVVKTKKDSDEAAKYSDYFEWEEPLKRCSSHRLLAMRRGENEGILRVSINIDEDECLERIQRSYLRGNRACQLILSEAIADSLKRLLLPSIENEFAALSKQQADEEAIRVFTENLRQLLLGAPLGQKRVMGIDPGFRTGCKVVCLDAQGNLLFHEAIFPHPPVNKRAMAASQVENWVKKYQVEAIAIGNGTASRETNEFVRSLNFTQKVDIFVVSEDGASVYSASKTAREEFPDQDVTVRGAVSIARRLMDPLAELVKIDPKSIGVGQYQHDVDQKQLKVSLDQVVESCVNRVGVDVNTASKHLLTYVSGLGPTLAQNIVDYRKENGAFTSRKQLLKVPRLGNAAFTQCAGFLRVSGSKNPLDNSAVHPESYAVVEKMAADLKCSVLELIANASLRSKIQPSLYVTAETGLPTIQDILQELDKPGRDPRNQLEVFEFDPSVKTPEDLIPGMELPGIVTNITNFGAFVDIGVHQDGLVHVSQMANHFVSDPTQVVHLHEHVRVRVLEVDSKRHRISLSMKLK